jgi:hypothetical protein
MSSATQRRPFASREVSEPDQMGHRQPKLTERENDKAGASQCNGIAVTLSVECAASGEDTDPSEPRTRGMDN